MRSSLEPGEAIVLETRANLGDGLSAREGRLTLTDRRLVFEPLQVVSAPILAEIPVGEIAGADRVWLPGSLGPRVIRAIEVSQSNGDRLTFVVRRPMRWRKALARHFES